MQKWEKRNGESALPEIDPDECEYYWFEGRASYDDWSEHRGNMIVLGNEHTDRVVGLVFLMWTFDIKHPKRDEHGWPIKDHVQMFAEPETMGYELHRCIGKWWGPVPVPRFDDENILLSLARVEDYAEWKAFEGAFAAELGDT